MENHPVVSVITPSFNQGQFLAATIESVLGQEGDFYLDYIIMDGGSMDDSVEIIKRYERLLQEKGWQVQCRGITYRWVSEKDRGQTDAISKGFSRAEGEIFAWLNSDDLYLPGTLQTVAEFFRETPGTALVYGDAHFCDYEGKIIGQYPTEGFDLNKLAYRNFFCQPSTFFRKNSYEAVGGLDDSLRFTMDYDLFIRMGKQLDCRYLPQFLSQYRLHETSKTMHSDELFEYHEEILRLTLKHFNWAPVNQVYGSCDYLCRSRLPDALKRFRPLVIGCAAFCTICRSLWLNRGLRRQDLKLLTLANFRKLFRERLDILRG
jgi:glycosyltransferase involved in cell wall biosynthesis